VSAATLVVSVVLGVLAVGLVMTEQGGRDVRRLALVAALAAAATAGRVLFAAIPSVKPVTVIVLVTGAVLGARAGFAVGALTPVLSNMVFGQGSWTPGQMALWGAAGLVGAALPAVCRRAWGLAAVGFIWGWVFGWGMTLWELATFGPQVNRAAFTAKVGTGVWFDAAHAVGNVVFALTIGPALIRLLMRYRDRIETTIDWDSAPRPEVA
jgi:energy-coupling factor transport system substrate-specific component